jgi:uncharacterized protein (TIGR00251 family)
MARLWVRVQAGAARSGIVGWEADGTLRLRLAAPAIEGRANRALVELLAEALDVRRSAVSLVRGETARRKLIEIEGLDLDDIRRRLPPGR